MYRTTLHLRDGASASITSDDLQGVSAGSSKEPTPSLVLRSAAGHRELHDLTGVDLLALLRRGAGRIERQATTSATADQRVRAAILEHYLELERGCTAAELASRVGRSIGWVRKVLREHHGAVAGTEYSREARVSHSRDYPTIEHGAHWVGVYWPSLAALRGVILDLRGSGPSIHGRREST